MDASLPPGQRARGDFPRFGVPAYAKRLSKIPDTFELKVEDENGSACAPVRIEDFNQLRRKEIVADFHCVATWSRRALTWSGYPFRDFYRGPFIDRARPSSSCIYLDFKSLDGYRVCILLEDLLREEVLLADRLDGQPLSLEHGGPMRLVTPHLYAYKSAKHVCAIRPRAAYRRSFAERRTLAHSRGRVALEERGRGLPGPIYRLLYCALLPPTLWYYRRVSRQNPR